MPATASERSIACGVQPLEVPFGTPKVTSKPICLKGIDAWRKGSDAWKLGSSLSAFRRLASAIAPPSPSQYHGRMGFSETVFLFFLALLIFGPRRLPEIARQVGKIVGDLKRASNEFQAQIKSEISQLELEEHRKALESSEPPVGSVPASALYPELVDAPDPEKPAPVPETHSLLKAAPDA